MLPIEIGLRNEIVRDFDADAKSPATGHAGVPSPNPVNVRKCGTSAAGTRIIPR
jgi:hypothetical protein